MDIHAYHRMVFMLRFAGVNLQHTRKNKQNNMEIAAAALYRKIHIPHTHIRCKHLQFIHEIKNGVIFI